MKLIELDAASWQGWEDFYEALLDVLQAPGWHGHNLDALYDSMMRGGINGIEAPYRIRFVNLNLAAATARQTVLEAVDALSDENRPDFETAGGTIDLVVGSRWAPEPTN